MFKIFTKHPNEVGETYFGHAKQALGISIKCQLAFYTQLIHAVFPFIPPLFNTDVCSLIKFLEKKLPENRKRDNCE